MGFYFYMKIFPNKNIYNDIVYIAIPVVGGLLTQMILSLVDTAMIGRLENSQVALAALGLAFLASWTITSFFSSMSTGTHVLVARRHGSGDMESVASVLNNSLIISFSIGIIISAIGYLYSYELMDFLSKDSSVALEGQGYLSYRFLGLPFFLMIVTYRGFFYGIGQTKIFLWSAIIVMCVHILGNILFIYGNLGFPKLGLTGAGVSSFISMIFGWLFFFIVTFLKEYRIKYGYFKQFFISLNTVNQILKISMPVSLQNVLILLGFLIFIAVTGIIGTAQQAASQLVTSAIFISFIPCFGLGIAAQTLVGQALGKNNKTRARLYGLESAKIGTIITFIIGLIFIGFPDIVLSSITNNNELIKIARPLLRIAGFAQIFYGAGIILAHALQAAGETIYVMIVEVITHWLLFLPLSYILGIWLEGGIIGAWCALPVYVLMFLGMNYYKFIKGSWMSNKV